jgi:cellulose 1,4-beta-cellobiosidase
MTRRFLARTVAVVSTAMSVAGIGVTPAGAADPVTGAVVCTYTVSNAWAGGFTANLDIANAGPAIDGWTVRWTFAVPTSGIQGWAALITQQGAVVTATNMSWNQVIDTGQVLDFGWSASAPVATVPTDITVNGERC